MSFFDKSFVLFNFPQEKIFRNLFYSNSTLDLSKFKGQWKIDIGIQMIRKWIRNTSVLLLISALKIRDLIGTYLMCDLPLSWWTFPRIWSCGAGTHRGRAGRGWRLWPRHSSRSSSPGTLAYGQRTALHPRRPRDPCLRSGWPGWSVL